MYLHLDDPDFTLDDDSPGSLVGGGFMAEDSFPGSPVDSDNHGLMAEDNNIPLMPSGGSHERTGLSSFDLSKFTTNTGRLEEIIKGLGMILTEEELKAFLHDPI
ncbi:hypothetical protein ACJZ2D_005394 [Fusarium nematophilum]